MLRQGHAPPSSSIDPRSSHTIEEALSFIRNKTALPHPLGPLLESFVSQALHPPLAAAHILRACRAGEHLETELLTLVTDWIYIVESITKYGIPPPPANDVVHKRISMRDGDRCCITGKPASLRDPLVVLPLLPIPSRWLDAELTYIIHKPRILDMLRAFFGPPYLDWWLRYVRQPGHFDPHTNRWLVRRSAAEAYKRGLLTLDRLQPSMVEYRITPCLIGTLEDMIEVVGPFPLLGDHSRYFIPKVDARFVGTHARMSPSVRWLEVRSQIAQDERISVPCSTKHLSSPRSTVMLRLSRFFSNACLKVWLLVPDIARRTTYNLLKRLGLYLYGGSDAFHVQRLPFGLYLKTTTKAGAQNEHDALDTIHRYTSIPAPWALDVVSDGKRTHLLTLRLPGVPLAHAMDMLSDRDCRDFVSRMQDYVTQLRAIPRPNGGDDSICNIFGDACSDPRIRDGNPIGPFKDEEAFSRYLRYPDDPARRGHKIVFTHADLNLRNILVDRITRPDGTRGWTLVGIVDWENSGFYPEYWDCTKAQFEGSRWDERWRRALFDVFRPVGDYSKELELERKSWREGDGA
ncbi:hypothetical protein F66182_9910 [Fusarium sp. NRRL 66182]|nr:hypothetical protein F66182_9910 [Fusarium sp. NRRL 66182]